MNNSVKFWDKTAEAYSKQPIADEAAYQKKLQVTRKYLRSDMSVLEFGCGTGSTAIAHAPYVKHILAIDFSSKMIEIARRKAEANKITNVTFERSTIDELSVGDRTLDVVLGLNVLHLLKSKEKAIALVYRMLKPGGVFVTSTVCLGDTMKWFKLVAPIGKFLGMMPNVMVFATKELSDSLTDAGFTIDYHWQPSQSVNQGMFKLKGVFIVAKKS